MVNNCFAQRQSSPFHPAAQGLILGVSKIFMHDLNVADIYQWLWLDIGIQRLNNVDGTHLVLVI